jgi:hypothetical protein
MTTTNMATTNTVMTNMSHCIPQSTTATATFDDLPSDIIWEISNHLGIDNIPFSIACKRNREVSKKQTENAKAIIQKIKLRE